MSSVHSSVLCGSSEEFPLLEVHKTTSYRSDGRWEVENFSQVNSCGQALPAADSFVHRTPSSFVMRLVKSQVQEQK